MCYNLKYKRSQKKPLVARDLSHVEPLYYIVQRLQYSIYLSHLFTRDPGIVKPSRYSEKPIMKVIMTQEMRMKTVREKDREGANADAGR